MPIISHYVLKTWNKVQHSRVSGLEKSARGFYNAAVNGGKKPGATGKKKEVDGGGGKQRRRSNKHKRQ